MKDNEERFDLAIIVTIMVVISITCGFFLGRYSAKDNVDFLNKKLKQDSIVIRVNPIKVDTLMIIPLDNNSKNKQPVIKPTKK